MLTMALKYCCKWHYLQLLSRITLSIPIQPTQPSKNYFRIFDPILAKRKSSLCPTLRTATGPRVSRAPPASTALQASMAHLTTLHLTARTHRRATSQTNTSTRVRTLNVIACSPALTMWLSTAERSTAKVGGGIVPYAQLLSHERGHCTDTWKRFMGWTSIRGEGRG